MQWSITCCPAAGMNITINGCDGEGHKRAVADGACVKGLVDLGSRGQAIADEDEPNVVARAAVDGGDREGASSAPTETRATLRASCAVQERGSLRVASDQ